MQLRADQLQESLNKGLAPIYFINGDELLLVQECCALILERALQEGYTEREVLTVEPGFDWNGLIHSCQSLSLFSSRRILDLRLPGGKPGEAGSKVLVELASEPPPDTLVLVSAGKLEKQTRQAKWCKALATAGVTVTVYPLEARELPAWIARRMRARGLEPGAGVAQLLAYHFEGNLLAAAQEVDKLTLVFGGGAIGLDDIQDNLSDNARFNVFVLVDACLQGDANAATRMLSSLQAEGVPPTLILWSLAREMRNMALIAGKLAAGADQNQVWQACQVWPRRRPLVKQALKRVPGLQWQTLLQRAARADRVIKGRLSGDTWQELWVLALAICGLRPPPAIG